MATDIAEFIRTKRKAELDDLLGVPTIDHSIEIISTELQTTGSRFTEVGDPIPRAPFVRSTVANCSEKDAEETISWNLTETQTNSWKFSSEVTVEESLEVKVAGDVLVAEAELTGTLSLGVTIGGEVSGSASKQVTLADSVKVVVAPKTLTVLNGQVWSTKVEGEVLGDVVVRYWHQYTLDFTFPQSNHRTARFQALFRIPFKTEFEADVITFTKVIRSKTIDCDRFALVLPGDEGSVPEGHPLFASRPAAAPAELATRASAVPGRPAGVAGDDGADRPVAAEVSRDRPSDIALALVPEAVANLDRAIAVARTVDSVDTLMAELRWPAGERPGALRLFNAARENPGLSGAAALDEGLVRVGLLGRISL